MPRGLTEAVKGAKGHPLKHMDAQGHILDVVFVGAEGISCVSVIV